MEDKSILIYVKQALGLTDGYNVFDHELIGFINSALAVLTQLGVGPSVGFTLTGPFQLWGDITKDPNLINIIPSYVVLRTKLIFDPPATGFHTTAIQESIDELAWRIENLANPADALPDKSTVRVDDGA